MANKTLIRAAATSLGALSLLVVTATASNATTAWRGSNSAEATSKCMRAFDGEADGNGVYADAYLANGSHQSAWDGNGAHGDWGPWTCYTSTIDRFRVCEDHSGCSSWISRPARVTTTKK